MNLRIKLKIKLSTIPPTCDSWQGGTHPLDISPNPIHTTQVNQTNIMTPELAISLLKKGTTGDEILKILDSLVENPDDLIVAIGQSSNWHKVD